MDQGKEYERKMYERETGYRAEKTRGGRYRYFSNATNKRITPLEYEEIYLPKVAVTTSEKSIAIKQFLQGFDKDVWGETAEYANDEQQARQSNEEDSHADEIVDTTADEIKVVEDDNMDIEESPSATNEEEETNDEAIQLVTTSAKVAPRQMVLPLPSRDEVSSDPDIAEAHRKLWAAFDDALETYSRTVLAIEAAKEFAECD